jgi:hypothetical protein
MVEDGRCNFADVAAPYQLRLNAPAPDTMSTSAGGQEGY